MQTGIHLYLIIRCCAVLCVLVFKLRKNMKEFYVAATSAIFFVFCCSLVAYDGLYLNNEQKSVNYKKKYKGTNEISRSLKEESMPHSFIPTFGVIVCCKDGLFDSIICRKQFRQTIVLLKSAATLTRNRIRILAITDTQLTFERFIAPTLDWPDDERAKFIIERYETWFPQEDSLMAHTFRHCTGEKLYLNEIMPNEDAIIIIDTDTIFLRPPEDMWQEFKNFNDDQIFGIAPNHGTYGSKKTTVPFYGIAGLNAGVVMTNITRLKKFPGGWTNYTEAVLQCFGDILTLAEQDVFNAVFNMKPKLLYELSCDWNYRYPYCSKGLSDCISANNYGASLLHGFISSMVSGKAPKFQVMFEEWEHYEQGTSKTKLLSNIMDKLAKVTSSVCHNHQNIDEILTIRLNETIVANSK